MLKWCRNNWRVMAWTLGVGVALALYLSGIKKLWPHNPLFSSDPGKTYDQTFYIQMAEDLATGNAALLPRSRMPLYPWLMHWFYQAKATPEEQLVVYMRLNVCVSLVCLGGIFFMLRRALGSWLAFLTTLVAALRVFVFKAVLVQPEILFYTLFLWMFVLMLRLLRQPSWRLAIFTGLVAGLAQLTKGSALTTIVFFLGIACFLALRQWWTGRAERRPLWTPEALQPLAFLGAFLVVTGIYFFNSYREYGSPFYDPNTRYYFWAESPEEMVAMQRMGLPTGKPCLIPRHLDDEMVCSYLKKWAADDRLLAEITDRAKAGETVVLEGKYDILPSSRHWLKTHSVGEIGERIWGGLVGDFEKTPLNKMTAEEIHASKHALGNLPFFNRQAADNSLVGHNRDHPNGYWPFLSLTWTCAGILFVLAVLYDGRTVARELRERWPGILFVLASLSLTVLAYAWWGQISFRNRYFLSIYLPLMLCFSLICRFSSRHVPIRLEIPWGRQILCLRAYTLFLLIYTYACITDLDDPLNHGNIRNSGDYGLLIVQ